MQMWHDVIEQFQRMVVLRHALGFSLQLFPFCYLIIFPQNSRLTVKGKNQFWAPILGLFILYLIISAAIEYKFYPDTGARLTPGIIIMAGYFRLTIVVVFILFMAVVKRDFFYKFSVFMVMANYHIILTISVNIYSRIMASSTLKFTYPYRLDEMIVYAALLLVTFPLAVGLVKKVCLAINIIPYPMHRKPVFLMVPTLSMIFLLALYLHVAFADEINFGTVIFALLSYLAVSTMHGLLFMVAKEISVRNQKSLQLFALETTYEKMSEHIAQMNRLRHETNNRIAYMQLCLRAGDYEAIRRYLDEFGASPALSQSVSYTKDTFLNGILNYAMEAAAENKISLKASILTSCFAPLSPVEITSVLMNFLNNAIRELKRLPDNASAEDRDIRLIMTCVNGELLIACRNKLLHKIMMNEDGQLISHYHGDSKLHGLGLTIVKGIAEEHHGRLNIAYDNLFTVSVFIPTTCAQKEDLFPESRLEEEFFNVQNSYS